jgi:biopolymer transport protein ExbD
MLNLRTQTQVEMNRVTLRPLGLALALFAVMMAVVGLAFPAGRAGVQAAAMPLSPPREAVDLMIQPDGYATLRGITFPVDDLQDQLKGLDGERGMPAVRVRVPREMDVDVLLKVMSLLKTAAVPQTTVDILKVP